jgi:predicted dehydrogenase
MKTHTISRRNMLARSSAALGVATVIPASALGLDARPAANDRIVSGAIGVGGMGSHDAKAIARGTQMVAVCDVVESKCNAMKALLDETYGNRDCQTYSDFRALLARDDIDVVCIGTPDHWHVPIAVAAAKAGKDIFCEKPLSLTIREARAAVDAVRRYGRVFQTHNNWRSGVKRAYSILHSGVIGDLRAIHVRTSSTSGPCDLPPEPVPPGVDWEMWLGPAPWRPFHSSLIDKRFRPYRDYSGGAVTDIGAHQFDRVQHILDTKYTGPVEIHPPGTEDETRTVLRYADGIPVYFAAGGVGTSFLIEGTKGTVTDGGKTDPPGLREKLPPDAPQLEVPNFYGDFLNSVRTRATPASDVEIGARAVTICHLINIALWTGRSIRWDPEREEIIGDSDLARWLDRPRREPWRL